MSRDNVEFALPLAELENIYEPTKATAEGAKTIAMLHELLEKYQHCSGADCP